MKYVLPFVIGMFLCVGAKSQINADYLADSYRINKNGMFVLSGFSIANITSSLIGLQNNNATNTAFHQMNIGWNGVNLILGASGLWQAYHPKNYSNATESMRFGLKTEQLFLVNAVLDIGYIAGGALVKETRYRNPSNWNQATGWGNAIMYNGSFLLAFDGVMYVLHHHHNKKIWNAMQQIQLGYLPNGFNLSVKF